MLRHSIPDIQDGGRLCSKAGNFERFPNALSEIQGEASPNDNYF